MERLDFILHHSQIKFHTEGSRREQLEYQQAGLGLDQPCNDSHKGGSLKRAVSCCCLYKLLAMPDSSSTLTRSRGNQYLPWDGKSDLSGGAQGARCTAPAGILVE